MTTRIPTESLEGLQMRKRKQWVDKEHSMLSDYSCTRKKRKVMKNESNVYELEQHDRNTGEMKGKRFCLECGVFGEHFKDTRKNEVVCLTCGYCEQYYELSIRTMTHGENREYRSYSYKRVSHFMELVRHLQANEITQVPAELVERCRLNLTDVGHYRVEGDNACLNKSRDENRNIIQCIRLTLKKEGARKYYDYTCQIYARLFKGLPYKITHKDKLKLRNLFVQMQRPYEQVKPKNRQNFFSYPFIAAKLFQKIGMDDVLPFLNVLKGKSHLKIQEEIYYKVVQHMKLTSDQEHQV